MKLREAVKSVILVLLILSTLVMTVRLWSVDERLGGSAGFMESMTGLAERVGLSDLLERLRGTAETPDEVAYSDRLVSPVRLLVREDGRLFELDFGGERRLTQSLGEIYTLLDGCLEASASKLTGGAAREAWERALLSDGVLLDLGRPVSYPVLAGGLSDANPELSQLSLRHLMLTAGERGIRCVLKDAATGEVYLFDSPRPAEEIAAAATPLMQEAALLPVSLAADGFDEGSYPEELFDWVTLAPEILVLPDATGPSLTASNPIYSDEGVYNIQLIYELLDVFEYNPKAKSYPDVDAVTYVENFSSIRIETNGWLRYKANQATGGIPVESLIGTGKESYSGYEMVMAAVRFLSRFDSRMAGGDAASLHFSGVSYDEQSRTVAVDFVYMSGGIPVDREEGYGARVTFEAGYLRYADILLREYAASGTAVKEIGFLKALELLATSTDRPGTSLSSFELHYEDTGSGGPIRPQYEGRTLGGGGR